MPAIGLAQGVVEVEVQRPIQPADVGLQHVGRVDDFAEVEGVGLFALAGVDEVAPEIGAGAVGVVQAIAVDVEFAQPVEGVFDHPVAGGRMGQVDFGHGGHPKKAAIPGRGVIEGEPVAVGGGAAGQGRLEDGVLVGQVVAGHIEQDPQPAGMGGVDQFAQDGLVAQTGFHLAVIGGVVAVGGGAGPQGA